MEMKMKIEQKREIVEKVILARAVNLLRKPMSNDRDVRFPSYPIERLRERTCAQLLWKQYHSQIHPTMMGHRRGRSLTDAVLLVAIKKAEGHEIATADISSAFPGTNMSRLCKLERRLGVPTSFFPVHKYRGQRVTSRGLIQGLSTSSPRWYIFASHHLVGPLALLHPHQPFWLWVDDFFGWAKAGSGGGQLLLDHLRDVTAKANLKLSEKYHKCPRVLQPNEPTPCLGVILHGNGIIDPKPGSSALHFWNVSIGLLKKLEGNSNAN